MAVRAWFASLLLVVSSFGGEALFGENGMQYQHALMQVVPGSTALQRWKYQTQQLLLHDHQQQTPQQQQRYYTQDRSALKLDFQAGSTSSGSSVTLRKQQQPALVQGSTDALAPEGGLPLSITRTLNPRLLFMAALADFAYVKELGSSTHRQACGPCLRMWGALGNPVVVDATDTAGGVSHCTVFRTDYDLFLVFRGLDELSNVYYIEMDTAKEYAAAYFGASNATGHTDDQARIPNIQSSLRSSSSSSGSGNDDSGFYVLRGFLRAHMALEPMYTAQLNRMASQLPKQQHSRYRVWIVGHSDGSSLAQLAALRLSFTLGAEKLGGVVLFGAQRVGSPAFADYYNSVLGSQTVRVQYGWDPATESQYLARDGLKLVGKGFAICPNYRSSVERTVEVPMGVDVPFVCGVPKPGSKQAEFASVGMAGLLSLQQHKLHKIAEAAVQEVLLMTMRSRQHVERNRTALAGYRRQTLIWKSGTTCAECTAGIPGATQLYCRAVLASADATHFVAGSGSRSCAGSKSGSIRNGIFDIEYLAHHMPAVIYDGLLRVLGSDVDNSTLAALQLPQCAISSKCAAALRQKPGSRCNTCAATETCSVYWQGVTGPKCDNLHPLLSGNLCYSSYFPPGIIGLLGLLENEWPTGS